MGFFSNLFSSKPTLAPIDLSVLKTDLHSHFIPGIDDGAQRTRESIALLKRMQQFGYKKVITTPHIMSDYYKNNPEIILRGLERVKKAIAEEADLDIEIEAAAEYYLDDSLQQKIDDRELLTFGDNYVLFELPFLSEPTNLSSIIFELHTAGYKPILAHPEKYSFWYKNKEKFQDMKDRGVFLQLNITSLTGPYPPETKKIAEYLVEKEMISFVGTDCHNMAHLDMVEQARTEQALHDVINSGKLLHHTL